MGKEMMEQQMGNVKFIAEICSSHNQSMSRTKQLIDKAKEVGFDMIKFQEFKASSLYADRKHYDVLKSREFPQKFIPIVTDYCRKQGLEVGFSVFYLEAVDKLKKHVDFFKISSFDICRLNLIKKCFNTLKPLYISCGLADEDAIFNIINLHFNNFKFNYEQHELTFMHCISDYPAKVEDCKLKRIGWLKHKFEYNIGYSDHSASIPVIIQALQNGVKCVEMHVDLDDMQGAESGNKHVWSFSKCKELFQFIKDMEISNTGRFGLTGKDILRRASAFDGMRYSE